MVYIESHGKIIAKEGEDKPSLIDLHSLTSIEQVIKVAQSRPGELSMQNRGIFEYENFEEIFRAYIEEHNRNRDLTKEDVLRSFLKSYKEKYTRYFTDNPPGDQSIESQPVFISKSADNDNPNKLFVSLKSIDDPEKFPATVNLYQKQFMGPQTGFYDKIYEYNWGDDQVFPASSAFFQQLEDLRFPVTKTRKGMSITLSQILEHINKHKIAEHVIIIDTSCNKSEVELYRSPNAVNGGARKSKKTNKRPRNNKRRRTIRKRRSIRS